MYRVHRNQNKTCLTHMSRFQVNSHKKIFRPNIWPKLNHTQRSITSSVMVAGLTAAGQFSQSIEHDRVTRHSSVNLTLALFKVAGLLSPQVSS